MCHGKYVAGSFVKKNPMSTVPCKRLYGKGLNDG
jgi:hypothetical protein